MSEYSIINKIGKLNTIKPKKIFEFFSYTFPNNNRLLFATIAIVSTCNSTEAYTLLHYALILLLSAPSYCRLFSPTFPSLKQKVPKYLIEGKLWIFFSIPYKYFT